MRCKPIGFDMIVSSDLSRAVQTTEEIVSLAPCDFSTSPAFREIGMGHVYTKSWSDYPDNYAQWVLHNENIRNLFRMA